MIKKADIILAVILVVLSLMVVTVTAFSKSDGQKVIIKVDNESVYELPLNTDNKIVVENHYGTNTVIVSDKKVSVIDADCPDGYCENHIAITKKGETIACLPHRLVVEIGE